MAEMLMAPVPEADQSAADAGYGDDFEGFAGPADPELSAEGKMMKRVHQPDEKPAAEKTAPGNPPSPSVSGSTHSLHDTPFQVCSDQSRTVRIPVASQSSPGPDVAGPDKPAAPAAESAAGPTASEEVSGSDSEGKPVASSIDAPEESAGGKARGSVRGPFLARLERFGAVLRRDLDARAMFLIDHQGQILLDEVENPKLIEVARTLANASYRATRQTTEPAVADNLHVKISACAVLEVVPVQSRYGLLILGVVFPAPLGVERVGQVARFLHKTVEPSSR